MPSTKTEALIRNRISALHQDNLAESIGLSKSQISRIVSGDNGVKLQHIEQFLNTLGLKIIDEKNEICISREEYAALRLFAAKALQGDAK